MEVENAKNGFFQNKGVRMPQAHYQLQLTKILDKKLCMAL